MKKNYIGLTDDASGSMSSLAKAAIADSNANIMAIKDAATREQMDTIVFGNRFNSTVTRDIVNSNPHVLTPRTSWPSSGMTAMYDGIGDMIEQLMAVPDYSREDVSFLVIATTDGDENMSHKYDSTKLKAKITELQRTGRWTFVLRVPRNQTYRVSNLGIPAGNIQEWDTTTAGMAASTAATTAAVESYYSARASGQKSVGTFYATASNVSAAQVVANLENISAQVSLWSVMPEENGDDIKPFAEKRLSSPFLKGAAFYQLTKTEARVQDTKLIIIRDKTSGNVYFGPAARQMIGLPTVGTCRLHPGDHGNFDLFIQSTSINRRLVAGTALLYWPKAGVPFKPEDTAYLNPKPVVTPVAAPATMSVAPIVSPKPTNKPTPSPLHAKTVAKAPVYFPSREAARKLHSNADIKDAGVNAPKGKRWYVVK